MAVNISRWIGAGLAANCLGWAGATTLQLFNNWTSVGFAGNLSEWTGKCGNGYELQPSN